MKLSFYLSVSIVFILFMFSCTFKDSFNKNQPGSTQGSSSGTTLEEKAKDNLNGSNKEISLDSANTLSASVIWKNQVDNFKIEFAGSEESITPLAFKKAENNQIILVSVSNNSKKIVLSKHDFQFKRDTSYNNGVGYSIITTPNVVLEDNNIKINYVEEKKNLFIIGLMTIKNMTETPYYTFITTTGEGKVNNIFFNQQNYYIFEETKRISKSNIEIINRDKLSFDIVSPVTRWGLSEITASSFQYLEKQSYKSSLSSTTLTNDYKLNVKGSILTINKDKYLYFGDTNLEAKVASSSTIYSESYIENKISDEASTINAVQVQNDSYILYGCSGENEGNMKPSIWKLNSDLTINTSYGENGLRVLNVDHPGCYHNIFSTLSKNLVVGIENVTSNSSNLIISEVNIEEGTRNIIYKDEENGTKILTAELIGEDIYILVENEKNNTYKIIKTIRQK